MKITAVVVDDEPITRMDISGILTEAGHEVLAQGNDGFDAIELCRLHHPDAILLDIKMPTFDGLSAATTILREELAGCVILLTAFHDKGFVDKAKQIGVTGYLVKPVDERTLLSTLEISVAQGARYREMQNRHESIQQKLEDRNLIDRAKAAVARRDGLSESEAYAQIQKAAMDKGVSMADLARLIMDSAEDKQLLNEAKLLLMERHRLNENAAFRRIRELAENKGVDLTVAAQEILRKGGNRQ